MAKRKSKIQAAEAEAHESEPKPIEQPAAVETVLTQPEPEQPGRMEGETRENRAEPRRPSMQNPFCFRNDLLAGVELLEDRIAKQMIIRFPEKPSDAVRAAVQEAGFRWKTEAKHWTRPILPEAPWKARADAENLFEQVSDMIRVEKGIKEMGSPT